MTHVDWYPYPKEKPTEEKEYLVSFYNLAEKRSGVDLDFYVPESDCWDILDDGVYTRVYAWAEKPEPFEEKKVDMHQDAITARKYLQGDPETLKIIHIFEE